jgi:hypothetical protein
MRWGELGGGHEKEPKKATLDLEAQNNQAFKGLGSWHRTSVLTKSKCPMRVS